MKRQISLCPGGRHAPRSHGCIVGSLKAASRRSVMRRRPPVYRPMRSAARDTPLPGGSEAGIATAGMLGALAVLTMVFIAIITAASIAQTRHYVQAGADMGAIAAAEAIARGEAGDACAFAEAAATANHAYVVACEREGERVHVETAANVRFAWPVGMVPWPVIRAEARAGPEAW